MKAKAHFITPTFVLHIDKHNLPVTFCPQSAVSSLSVSLHLGLHTSSLKLQNNVVFLFFFPPPRLSLHIQRIRSLCHDLFMHYTSFLNNLSSHLSIFPPLPPSVSASLSSAWLKAFHLATISTPGQLTPTTPQPCTHLPIRLNSYLTFYIPSSFLFLSFFSIFLPSYLSHPPSLCPLSTAPTLAPSPPAEIKPRWREPGPTTSPTEAQPHGPKKQTLKNKIKYIKTAMGSPLHGQCIFLDTISHFYILPALLHPVCLCFSPSVCFAPSLLPFPSFSDRHCRSLDSEASLQ